ncbi:hypothetical protein SAMN05444166_0354 [Singulisphaera sp. GP187]|nr:hypothetical protein [Singulisphaera sp. GP187]SIN71420.1 hypothetical protein SAMN05444166_0354 [Singulisphaera sp. GP187]
MEHLDFILRERAIFAECEALERDGADRDPGQGHDLVPELRQHPAHLAILPFGEDDLEDRRLPLLADHANASGADLAFRQPDSVDQLVEHLAFGASGHDNAVELLDAELGVRQLIGELAVVGQENQPRAHLVEAADGIDALGHLGKDVDHPGAAGRVVIGGDVPLGLGDRVIDHPLEMDGLTVDGDLGLPRVHLGSELFDDLTVNRHPPLADDILAGASRADSGVRENFLQSLHTRRRFLPLSSGIGRLPLLRGTTGPWSAIWTVVSPFFRPWGPSIGHDDPILNRFRSRELRAKKDERLSVP